MKFIQPLLISLSLIFTLLCLLGALSSGFGVRFGWWDFVVGFTVLKWSAYLTGIPVSLVIINAALAKISGTSIFNIRSIFALVLCAAIFGVPYMARHEFRKFPTLADATTSFDDAPTFVYLATARAQTAKNPLEFRGGDAIAKQQEFFPELVSFKSGKSPADIIKEAANIAKELGMDIAAAKPEEGRMEATETTFWFRFKDDVVVRARPLESGQTQIDVRSASRVGYLDGGINAKRVKHFIEQLAR